MCLSVSAQDNSNVNTLQGIEFDIENGGKGYDIPFLKLNMRNKGISVLESIAYSVGSTVAYGAVDYLLFNRLKWQDDTYRVFQGILISGINYLLAKHVGLSSALGFDISLLFGGADMIYYGLDAMNGGSEFRNTKNFSHLSFTPVALLGDGTVNKDGAIFQSQLGLAFQIAINWSF